MSRPPRIVLALLALAATAVGVYLARLQVGLEVRRLFLELATESIPSRQHLVAGVEKLVFPERLGEALVGLGTLILVVLAVRALRTSRAIAAAAIIVAIGAPLSGIAFPTARIPVILTMSPPSSEWPHGAVIEDRTTWTAFIVASKQLEWSGLIGESYLGPKGLELALAKRLARPDGKRTVRIFYDLRCPDEARNAFSQSAHAAADPAGVKLEEGNLPNPHDFPATRKLVREKQLAPFRETLTMASLARFGWAVILALVVWWASAKGRARRGVSIVTAAHLVLALGHVLAVPLAFYAAMLTDDGGGKSPFPRLAQNLLPHLAMAAASSVLMVIGCLAAVIGHALLETLPPEPESQLPPRPRMPLKRGRASPSTASPSTVPAGTDLTASPAAPPAVAATIPTETAATTPCPTSAPISAPTVEDTPPSTQATDPASSSGPPRA